jgi:hypothetical protein
MGETGFDVLLPLSTAMVGMGVAVVFDPQAARRRARTTATTQKFFLI